MRALLINKDMTITEIHMPANDTLKGIQEALGCDLIDAAGELNETTVAWVDGEGLLKNPTDFAVCNWYHSPLALPILVTGFDPDSLKTGATDLSIKCLAAKVHRVQSVGAINV